MDERQRNASPPDPTQAPTADHATTTADAPQTGAHKTGALAMVSTKTPLYKQITMLVILAAIIILALARPMFGLTIGDQHFSPSLFKMMTTRISVAGQVVSYPIASAIFGTLSLVSALAAGVLAFLKRPASGSVAAVLSFMTYLATGLSLDRVVGPALTAAGLEYKNSEHYLSFTGTYYITVVLLVLLAVAVYWYCGGESLARRLFLICACLSIASVLLITVYMLIIGLPAIIEIGPLNFLFGTTWDPTNSTHPSFGILPMILTSIGVTALSVVIGVPVGILTAVFLAEIAPKWVVNIVHPAVELLAGIPSVVYGFFALQILSPFIKKIFNLSSGDTMLTATIVLAIMILPTIITTCETGLRAVPDLYREASLAMGASRIRTIFKVVLPAARSTVLSGVILGVGRSIGETMAIIMVAGNSPQMPGLLESVRPLTVGIVMEMSYATGLHRDSLFSIGLVLFVFIMIVNVMFSYLSKKGVQLNERA